MSFWYKTLIKVYCLLIITTYITLTNDQEFTWLKILKLCFFKWQNTSKDLHSNKYMTINLKKRCEFLGANYMCLLVRNPYLYCIHCIKKFRVRYDYICIFQNLRNNYISSVIKWVGFNLDCAILFFEHITILCKDFKRYCTYVCIIFSITVLNFFHLLTQKPNLEK